MICSSKIWHILGATDIVECVKFELLLTKSSHSAFLPTEYDEQVEWSGQSISVSHWEQFVIQRNKKSEICAVASWSF